MSTVLQPRTLHCYRCGLGSCAFARHYLRNHFCFLLLQVLRCFSSPGLLCGFATVTPSLVTGCPIRKSTDQWIFAPHRSLSQLITSFFASKSLGILHVPFSPFLFSFSPCHSLIAERDPFVNFQAACLVAEQAARIGFGFFTRCVAESSLDSFLSLVQFALLST